MLKRIVVAGGALATAVTMAGVGLASVTDAGKTAATSAPAGPVGAVVVNRSSQSSAAYWTAERQAAAQPMERNRDAQASQSFGTAGLDFTRSRITPQSAYTAAPYKGAGKLFFTIPGSGNFVCSAAIMANRLVLTAAHCMFGTRGDGSKGYFMNWLFVPAYDGTRTGTAQRPYGTWDWEMGIVPGAYQASPTVVSNHDFGILQTADQSFDGGSTFKTLFRRVGFKFSTTVGHLFDTHVTSLGYPCNFDSCNIMQRNDSSDHRPSGISGSTAYEYGSDMTGGSSGGPWVENLGNPASASPTGAWITRNTIVGVTSYGYTDPAVKIQGASQLNADFTTIRNFACNNKPGNC